MVHSRKILGPKAFYVLSFTWGFLMTFIGLLVISSIKLYGLITKKSFKLKKAGYCYYIALGSKSWGGVNFGPFALVSSSDKVSTRWHEHGHAIQNCYWGILTLFVIAIPSFIRYHYRRIKYTKKNLKAPTSYYAIWFEDDAGKTGNKYKTYFKSIEKNAILK